MILIVFNSQEAHLSNGIGTRKNGYVLAEIWSAQAESKKHCNSFVRHCKVKLVNVRAELVARAPDLTVGAPVLR